TILVGNTFRKMFHFEMFTWVKWIEGIGSIKGLLFTSGDIREVNNDLICFKQNDTILFFNNRFSDCFPVTVNIEKNIKYTEQLEIFPNPATGDIININLEDNRIHSIEIINNRGEIIDRVTGLYHLNISIPTERYQPGIYFYKAIDYNDNLFSGKFIVL
ncbi:T9SS type A sorting domain-containing protein, partial [Bacteroidota bacterium]